MSEDQSVSRYILRAPNVNLDKPTLTALADLVKSGGPAVLFGFNDYAKHLINLFPEKIVAVVDYNYSGIAFRGKPVLAAGAQIPDCKRCIVCDYHSLFAFKQTYYSTLRSSKIDFCYLPKYEKHGTKLINFQHQDPLYQEIFRDRDKAPPSMLTDDGLLFMLELLRSCLDIPGDIIEIGAWQGGSAWFIAKMLSVTGSTKDLYALDLGEGLKPGPQAIVCDDQFRTDLSFYPRTHCLIGGAVNSLENIPPGPMAFIFLDFGFNERVMAFCMNRLAVGGVLLMDNYGHTLGHPDLFDAFLKERGQTAIRHGNSPVAFVVRRSV